MRPSAAVDESLGGSSGPEPRFGGRSGAEPSFGGENFTASRGDASFNVLTTADSLAAGDFKGWIKGMSGGERLNVSLGDIAGGMDTESLSLFGMDGTNAAAFFGGDNGNDSFGDKGWGMAVDAT